MIIKNPKLLEEDYKVDDLLDFSFPIKSFENRLETIEKPSIIGLIGKFGSGKSTMLYQIQKNKNDEELWINFDAWKYPDRKDLWEGFVLDFADQLGERTTTTKKIDGNSSTNDILDVASDITSKLALIPGLSILIEAVQKLIKRSPAKRVFEIQAILTQLVVKIDKPIYVIVEDIDRSGDAGIFFLETFKQFIKTLHSKHQFYIIVPISDVNYNKNTDSYLKTLDYLEVFSPSNLGFEKFVNAVFIDSLFEGDVISQKDGKIKSTGDVRKGQIISFLECLSHTYPDFSIRKLKLILRISVQNFILQSNDGHDPDFRVTLCIEAAKFMKSNNSDDETYFDRFLKNKKVEQSSIFATFIYAMIENRPNFHRLNEINSKIIIQAPVKITFIERQGKNPYIDYPSYPWSYGKFRDDAGIGICTYYLNY